MTTKREICINEHINKNLKEKPKYEIRQANTTTSKNRYVYA